MPVYEHYCPDCHTVFSFFSRRVDTETRPACPRCGRPDLTRQASPFAIGRRREGGGGDADPGEDLGLPDGMDEARLMRAFESMAGEMDGLDDNADPKQAARLMRRLFDSAGLKLGDGMAEAIRRMEAGEDPDAIDAELGDALEGEDPFAAASAVSGLSKAPDRSLGDTLKELRRGLMPPARDSNWYPLRPAGGDTEPPGREPGGGQPTAPR